jgi:hypothetical protein
MDLTNDEKEPNKYEVTCVLQSASQPPGAMSLPYTLFEKMFKAVWKYISADRLNSFCQKSENHLAVQSCDFLKVGRIQNLLCGR